MANYGQHEDCYPPGHQRGGPCGPNCPYNVPTPQHGQLADMEIRLMENEVKLGGVPPGGEVVIRAVVVEQNNGQTLIYAPGLGGRGLWSVPSTIDCEVTGTASPLQVRAIAEIGKRVGRDRSGSESPRHVGVEV